MTTNKAAYRISNFYPLVTFGLEVQQVVNGRQDIKARDDGVFSRKGTKPAQKLYGCRYCMKTFDGSLEELKDHK